MIACIEDQAVIDKILDHLTKKGALPPPPRTGALPDIVLIKGSEPFFRLQANARHILVSSEEECNSLKQQIIDGSDFAEIASAHSKCPSGKQGGDLGSFSPAQMVPEIDTVVFNETFGDVHGPVKTRFGYHLIEITSLDS